MTFRVKKQINIKVSDEDGYSPIAVSDLINVLETTFDPNDMLDITLSYSSDGGRLEIVSKSISNPSSIEDTIEKSQLESKKS